MKPIIISLLEHQARRFLAKHHPKLIAITGSVGKTTTKFFTATVLSQKYRVMTHLGNHNTEISVPLAIFDIPLPRNTKSAIDWLRVLWQTQQKIKQPFKYDILMLELGADKPGDIKRFGKYLRPDIAVVTAVAPEHMESFKTIEAVAQEELSVADYSQLLIVNRDDIDSAYAKYVQNSNIDTYGTSGVAEYRYQVEDFDLKKGFKGKLISPEFGELPTSLNLIGEHNIKPAVAAAAVAIKLGLNKQQLQAGLKQIQPVNGRMRVLRGQSGSTLIDDTYNSSPKAAQAALQTLYLLPGKQKIAILGSMNELGEFSKAAHEQVGKVCDPTLLDWLITIGKDANEYLAPAAESKGCQVRTFDSPYDAGAFAHQVMQPGAIVLAKGSQNGVYAEEALKTLLHSTQEESDLVRQEPEWLALKRRHFDKFKNPS